MRLFSTAAGRGADGCGTGRRGRCAHVLQGRAAGAPGQLPDLPPAGRSGADVARSPTSRRGRGPRRSRPPSPRRRCRRGSPTRRYGHFANERRLSAPQIELLSAWADAGAPAGDEKDAPPPITFENGWNITPDVVVEMPKAFELPARGTINYKYVLVKTNFKEDMWVVAAEMRPGNPAVLHHGKVWVRPPGSKWMEKAVPGEAYESETHRDILGRNAIEEGNDILGKFNPGLGAQRFDMEGAAKFVPKGSDLVFELHYTTTGEPTHRRVEARARAGQGAAADALLLQRRPDGVQPGDPGRRRQRRSGERDHVRRERTPGLRAAAHAPARQGLRAARRDPRQADADGAEGRLELRLADGLSVRRVDCAAQGLEAAAHLALRQLAGQPVQPRPGQAGGVGPPELGRDEQLLHRRARSTGPPRPRRCSCGRARACCRAASAGPRSKPSTRPAPTPWRR